MQQQTFTQVNSEQWLDLEQFPGAKLFSLAQLASEGSIHLLKMKQGTEIPIHTHPSDEYVYVLNGTIETGGKPCEPGTFWYVPAYTQQGSHKAITDVEIITIRLGKMGTFETH